MKHYLVDEYYLYLRKSRADRDAELHGAGETLLRHEKALMELAHRKKLNVTKIFREVVSGETIAARPEMQKLLEEVAAGKPTGVLVMEVERLARGDTKDQGTVADAFKMGNVKIITPTKTYDPNNEFDEEYFEFGLFMSRREYKAINRRIQRGRIASVKEGKYIASTAPYGYERVRIKNDKGYTLKIIPEQADVVRMIYSLYTHGELQADGSYKRLGMFLIAKKLDSMHIVPTNSSAWSRASIKDMLTNPTYAGKVRWQWKKEIKKAENGQIRKTRLKTKDYMIYEGLHEAIIDPDTFQKAQQIMSAHACPPVSREHLLKNPLSGIVVCGKCGRMMTRVYSNTKKGYYSLMCPNQYCDNVSAPLYLIENKILESLEEWLDNYKLTWNADLPRKTDDIRSLKESSVEQCKSDLNGLQKQLSSTYEFLEKGIYTTEIFLQRNQTLTAQIDKLRKDISRLEEELEIEHARERARKDIIPDIENVLELYRTVDDISVKNDLLKTILEKVVYIKDTPNKKGKLENANFTLTIYPKIPHS